MALLGMLSGLGWLLSSQTTLVIPWMCHYEGWDFPPDPKTRTPPVARDAYHAKLFGEYAVFRAAGSIEFWLWTAHKARNTHLYYFSVKHCLFVRSTIQYNPGYEHLQENIIHIIWFWVSNNKYSRNLETSRRRRSFIVQDVCLWCCSEGWPEIERSFWPWLKEVCRKNIFFNASKEVYFFSHWLL